MHRDHRLIDIGHMLIDAFDQGTKFSGGGVAHRVGDVDRAGTRGDRRLNHRIEEFGIGAAGVLTGKLHVLDEGAGIGHHLAGNLQHLAAAFAQFVLEVDVAGGNEGVDAAPHGWRHGIGAGLDVALGGPGQAADHRAIGRADAAGNALHGVEITGAGKGEARFDDVHLEAGQLLGDRQLFFEVEAGARGLLPIAQGGIEDQYPAGIAGHGTKRRNEYELEPV